MEGVVKRVSDFTKNTNWLFVFTDNRSSEYFVMGSELYEKNNLKFPVTKRELDSLDTGMKVEFDFAVIEGQNIVTKIGKYWIK